MKTTRAEMQQLVAAAMDSHAKMSDSRIMLAIFSKGYERDPVALMQFALAVILDKPIFLLVPKDRLIPANVRAVASGIEIYDPAGGTPAMEAATKKLLGKATEGM